MWHEGKDSLDKFTRSSWCVCVCVCALICVQTKLNFYRCNIAGKVEWKKLEGKEQKTENLAAKHMKQSLTYLQHGEALIHYV